MTNAVNDADWDAGQISALLVECGRIALHYWGQERGQLKGDHTLVTRADREIEDLLTRRLECPERGRYLLGEETVERKGEDYIRRALAGTAYVVDPVDGTGPYAHGLAHWGISIARMCACQLTDGALYLPVSAQLLITRGPAVRRLRIVEGEVASDEAMEPTLRGLDAGGLIAVGQDIAKRGRVHSRNMVQALGTAVIPLAYLAQGGFAAYASPVKLWDLAGGLPIVQRHGLWVGTLDGEPFDLSVTDRHYHLQPGHPKRWRTRGTMLACAPGDVAALRACIEVPEG